MRVDIIKGGKWKWGDLDLDHPLLVYRTNEPIQLNKPIQPMVQYRSQNNGNFYPILWCFREEVHAWFKQRDATYRLMAIRVNDNRPPQIYDVWVEIDDPETALLFKLTWGGQ